MKNKNHNLIMSGGHHGGKGQTQEGWRTWLNKNLKRTFGIHTRMDTQTQGGDGHLKTKQFGTNLTRNQINYT